MKKTLITMTGFLVCILLVSSLVGCSSIESYRPKEKKEVMKLKNKLIAFTEESGEKYFGKKIDISEFNIYLSKEVDEGNSDVTTLMEVTDLRDTNIVYLSGYNKGMQKDLIDFCIGYNIDEEKIFEFGINTIDQGRRSATLDE